MQARAGFYSDPYRLAEPGKGGDISETALNTVAPSGKKIDQ
jgi:hypothetical protein